MFVVGILGACTNILIAPVEAATIPRLDWDTVEGRDPHRLVLKFHEQTGLDYRDLILLWPELEGQVVPVFTEEISVLQTQFQRLQVKQSQNVEDLSTYAFLTGESAWLDAWAQRFSTDERFEHVYRAFLPEDPPMDIPPETPLYLPLQRDHWSDPYGFGFTEAQTWTRGEGIRIVDIEYSYDPLHEDLQYAPLTHAYGWDQDRWHYHGNAVLGQLIATDNAYGVTGAVPDAEVLVVSPYPSSSWYNVAQSLLASADFLTVGDIVLIEQQTVAFGAYCPIEYDPTVFDAIQWLVAMGIVVVEPAANGAQDLDDPQWEGWFDQGLQDSGAIMVGGSSGFYRLLHWSGSSYGSRIDTHGWFEGIVTTSTWEMADLFYPEDTRQAYTMYFGGTSGASPQIVSVLAGLQATMLAQEAQVWTPEDLRRLLRQTGRSQPLADRDTAIASQPSLPTLLKMWAW